MASATFRFYEELNDFLAPRHRRHDFDRACARAATVKHEIEALGVPHTEVELVLVNGESVGFDRIIRDGDRIAVYPKFEPVVLEAPHRMRDHRTSGGMRRIDERHRLLRNDHRRNEKENGAGRREPLRSDVHAGSTGGNRGPRRRQFVGMQLAARLPQRIGNLDPHEEAVQRQSAIVDVRRRLEHGERRGDRCVDHRLAVVVPSPGPQRCTLPAKIVRRVSPRLGGDSPKIHW